MTMHTRHARYLAPILLFSLTILASACSEDVQPATDCGEGGEGITYAGESFCVYRGNIIETRFQCPEDLAHRHDLGDGATVVCSGDGMLPGGFEDHLGREGWPIDEPISPSPDPIEPPEPTDPVDPIEPPDPIEPTDPPDPVDPPDPDPVIGVDFVGEWKFDHTLFHVGNLGYYDITPETFYESDGRETRRLLGVSVELAGTPRACFVQGEWTRVDERTMRAQSSCGGRDLLITFTPMNSRIETYVITLDIDGLSEDEALVPQIPEMIFAVRCSGEGGATRCAEDLPRHPDAVTPPTHTEPTESFFQIEGYWDFDAPTGAIRIATYRFDANKIELIGSSMEDYELFIALTPEEGVMGEPIRCPVGGDYYRSEDPYQVITTSRCDDGIERQIRIILTPPQGGSLQDQYRSYGTKLQLVGHPPVGYVASEFWAGHAAISCLAKPGSRQCFAFQDWEERYTLGVTCDQLDEFTCGASLGCEATHIDGSFIECNAIPCEGITDAQGCFDSPLCTGIYGPSECWMQEDGLSHCTNDNVFKSCSTTLSCKVADAQFDMNVCANSRGEWRRMAGQDPGICTCPIDATDRIRYGQRDYSRDVGCETEWFYCDELGGEWQMPEYNLETLRRDIPRESCAHDSRYPSLHYVWNEKLEICHRFDYVDAIPVATCRFEGEDVTYPSNIYHERLQDPKESACMMPASSL